MILGIEKELSIFAQAVLAGNVACLGYYVIRVFRRLIRHNLFWISVEDFCYWIGIGFYLFLVIFQTSNGSIRWYFVVGTLLGGILTYSVVQKILKKYIDKTNKKE